MPKLAELREQAGTVLKELETLRDTWHQQRADNKVTEAAATKATITEKRDALKKLYAQIDAEQESQELDDFLGQSRERQQQVLEERSGRRRRRRRSTPGRDDFELRFVDDPEQRGEDGAPSLRDRQIALQVWGLRSTGKEPSKRQREAVDRCRKHGLRYGRTIEFRSAPTEDFRRTQQQFRATHPSMIGGAPFMQRAMSTIIGSTGGYAVAPGFVAQLEINQLSFSGMLQVADVWKTTTGTPTPWPTADDTSNEGEQVGESGVTGTANSTNPTLSRIMFNAHKSHSKPIRCPQELLEDWDAAPAFEQFLNGIMSERLGRHRNRKYTLGLGNSEPMGIVAAAQVGRTTAAPTAFASGDDFLRLISSVDPAYRMGAAFMMHDSIWTEVLLLKDSEGRYIHTIGLDTGVRDNIRGYPVFYNQHMDSALAASNVVALFGQLSKYKVREVNQVRIKRFDELFGENDEVGFDSFIRHDGNLIDAGTGCVKKMQMAAA